MSDLGSFQVRFKDPDSLRMSKEKKWRKKEEQNDLLSSLNVSYVRRAGVPS